MKKLLILVLLVLLPVMMFADFQIGPTAMYNFNIGSRADLEDIDVELNNFTYGIDTRINWGIVQASAYALYSEDAYGSALETFLDIGLTLDLWILQVSAGIGPTLYYFFDIYDVAGGDPFQGGMNLKLSGDLQLGGVSFSLVYLTSTDLDLGSLTDSFMYLDGYFGASVLFNF